MAVKTTLEQLEEVQEAISLIMNGQEVSRDGKTWRMPDLGPLQAREEILLRRYRVEQGQGRRQNIFLPRRG